MAVQSSLHHDNSKGKTEMNKKIGNIFKGDKVIWTILFMLCMISIIEVFSASSGLTYKSNNYIMPILKHCVTLGMGVIAAIIIVNIPCKYFKMCTFWFILGSVIALVWVMFCGESINGANRVIEIGGQTFQPSEFAKGTVILAVAQILSATQTENGADKKAFKYILYITIPMALLIVRENLSTAALLCMVVLCMMIIGRVSMRQIGKLLGVVALGLTFAVTLIMVGGHDNTQDKEKLQKTETLANNQEDKENSNKILRRLDTWKARINNFLNNKEIPAKEYDLDKNAQVAHANIAIASSNIIGKGPGNSVERDFLAQAFSDFIFAIIIEEMGVEGAILVVFLYIILLFRAARIANRCEKNFPAFFVMGLALMLVVQATFNMMVAVGLAPVTGQPLPLISKGGTSTIINCAYIGAILSVSRSAKKKKVEPAPDKTNNDNTLTAA